MHGTFVNRIPCDDVDCAVSVKVDETPIVGCKFALRSLYCQHACCLHVITCPMRLMHGAIVPLEVLTMNVPPCLDPLLTAYLVMLLILR